RTPASTLVPYTTLFRSIVGLMGMPRRVYTYPAGLGWETYNLISTVGVFIIVTGIGVFILNLIRSHWKGEEAGPNPWSADTLEWRSEEHTSELQSRENLV